MNKKYVVVGGSNGVGAALSNQLIEMGYDVIICDYQTPCFLGSYSYKKLDLFKDDINVLSTLINESDGLFITAGIGRVAPIQTFCDVEVKKTLVINCESIIRILLMCNNKLFNSNSFVCSVITSVAGFVSSPLFAIYSASKAALAKYIEAINVEINKNEFNNRITNVIATSFAGTSFNGEKTKLIELTDISKKIIDYSFNHKEECYLNEKTTLDVIKRYQNNPKLFGLESYDYKLSKNRINTSKTIKIGYLSGTFDLFHIGHLNLLKNAKQYCDYLIVGVHLDATHKGKKTFISFEERCQIVKHVDYVDCVVQSCREDSDAWIKYHYDYLFVGSDYKGTERFNRYEDFFKDKGVTIIYFPYTKTTSSTELRKAILDKNNE